MPTLSAQELFDGLISGRYSTPLKDDPKWMINGLAERAAAYERMNLRNIIVKEKKLPTGEQLHTALRKGAFTGFGYETLQDDPLWNIPENKEARTWAWDRRDTTSIFELLAKALPEAIKNLGKNLIDGTTELCADPKKYTVVIDPGHGGSEKVGGSSANNATSFSGVKEKDMTLELATLVRDAFLRADVAIFALQRCVSVDVVLTRSEDVNLGLDDRARVAKDKKANLFLSLHFNGFNASSRGTETLVRLKSDNVNYDDDVSFAQKINDSAYWTLMMFDKQAHNRGVKDQELGVLKDAELGSKDNGCRACLLEAEFIDVKRVDELLNTNSNATEVKQTLARSIAIAILIELSLLHK